MKTAKSNCVILEHNLINFVFQRTFWLKRGNIDEFSYYELKTSCSLLNGSWSSVLVEINHWFDSLLSLLTFPNNIEKITFKNYHYSFFLNFLYIMFLQFTTSIINQLMTSHEKKTEVRKNKYLTEQKRA